MLVNFNQPHNICVVPDGLDRTIVAVEANRLDRDGMGGKERLRALALPTPTLLLLPVVDGEAAVPLLLRNWH